MLLEAIRLRSGYDFRGYARNSLTRRILRRLKLAGIETISAMQHKVIHDDHFLNLLLQDFSINVTQMFRDASFFKILREDVLRKMTRLPFIKIWHAGCSTGEEVYSTAILLKEMNLFDKSLIYATDSNIEVVEKAKKGIFPSARMKEYTISYQKAGGTESFADYYAASYDMTIINKALKKNIVFADHNLVTDHTFGEMDMIMCRNVLIYFTRELQDRVFSLFMESLKPGGFLCLGSKETIRFSKYANRFETYNKKEKIFVKQ
ncbi:MAG: protein-glutamate O-methyltransferase CheR [Pseudomonadota bacterium]